LNPHEQGTLPQTAHPVPGPDWPPYAYVVRKIDLSTARNGEKIEFKGNGVFVVDGSGPNVKIDVALNDPDQAQIPLRVGAHIQKIGFDRLYLYNNAGSAGQFLTLFIFDSQIPLGLGSPMPLAQYVDASGKTVNYSTDQTVKASALAAQYSGYVTIDSSSSGQEAVTVGDWYGGLGSNIQLFPGDILRVTDLWVHASPSAVTGGTAGEPVGVYLYASSTSGGGAPGPESQLLAAFDLNGITPPRQHQPVTSQIGGGIILSNLNGSSALYVNIAVTNINPPGLAGQGPGNLEPLTAGFIAVRLGYTETTTLP